MWTHVQENRDAIQQETAKKWRSNRKRWVDWIDNGLNSGCQLNPVHTKCNRTTKDHAIYIYTRYCQSLEPVKPVNGGKTAGGYPQHRRGVLGYWEHAAAPDRAEVQVMFKVTAQVVHHLQIQGFMRAVNDPISVLAHGGRTKRISFFPFAEMMVFRHTILDRPTTLLFGDWMLDCRCYPVFWAPSVKVHVQQKVMDLSLIHQKNTTLVGSILYRFCDFRWAPVVKIPHLLIVLLHLLHAEIVFSTFFHQRGFQTSGCNSDGGGETSVDSWLGATKTTTALLGPRHIFWCHNPLTGAKGTPVRSNSDL